MYEGQRIVMTRTAGQTVTTGYERTPLELETMTLRCWGRDGSVLRKLIDAALCSAFEETNEDIAIYVQGNSWMGGWEKALSKKPRSITSVVLDENIAGREQWVTRLLCT